MGSEPNQGEQVPPPPPIWDLNSETGVVHVTVTEEELGRHLREYPHGHPSFELLSAEEIIWVCRAYWGGEVACKGHAPDTIDQCSDLAILSTFPRRKRVNLDDFKVKEEAAEKLAWEKGLEEALARLRQEKCRDHRIDRVRKLRLETPGRFQDSDWEEMIKGIREGLSDRPLIDSCSACQDTSPDPHYIHPQEGKCQYHLIRDHAQDLI